MFLPCNPLFPADGLRPGPNFSRSLSGLYAVADARPFLSRFGCGALRSRQAGFVLRKATRCPPEASCRHCGGDVAQTTGFTRWGSYAPSGVFTIERKEQMADSFFCRS